MANTQYVELTSKTTSQIKLKITSVGDREVLFSCCYLAIKNINPKIYLGDKNPKFVYIGSKCLISNYSETREEAIVYLERPVDSTFNCNNIVLTSGYNIYSLDIQYGVSTTGANTGSWLMTTYIF
jgi:hypothetical protein